MQLKYDKKHNEGFLLVINFMNHDTINGLTF